MGSQDIHVIGFVCDVVFSEVDWGPVERIGFDYVATDFQKARVDLLYGVRPGH